jgi:hypothetical protein
MAKTSAAFSEKSTSLRQFPQQTDIKRAAREGRAAQLRSYLFFSNTQNF